MAEQEQTPPVPETEARPEAETRPEPTPTLAEAIAAEVAAEDALTARVAELEAQVRDTQLRAQAEIQNIQKRAERDVQNAHKFALEKFAGGLLDVVDNLERALDATPETEENKVLRDGIVLTHKSFIDALRRHAVEQVNPAGEPFNAELHQAVSMQPSTTAEPNSVLTVLAKGYTLSGRLLRPAIVVVATAG
ncbi:MAG: nucleotide exchange factor GrpE [Moraxellaceae bacterium]|nr:nucleotide exchange factor GrpE [Moraxellaceae bacterium]